MKTDRTFKRAVQLFILHYQKNSKSGCVRIAKIHEQQHEKLYGLHCVITQTLRLALSYEEKK